MADAHDESTVSLVLTLRSLGVWSSVCLCAACGSTDRDHPAAVGGSADGGSAAGNSNANAAGKANDGGSVNTSGASSAGGTSSMGGTSSTAGRSSAAGAAGTSVGGSGGSSSASEGPGTITEPWRAYCVATFTEDYPVKDGFGAPLFVALKGEEYLLMSYPEPFSRARIAYLTSTGPYSADVEPNAAHTGFPFTTDCAMDLQAGSYFGVFADVSVYAEPELATKLCDLKAGTALPRVLDAKGAGYALESNSAASAIYEIFLNAFSPQCGGASSGYVTVPVIQLFGSAHIVVPFGVITGP